MLDATKITSRYKAVPPGLPTIKPALNDYTWAEIKQISDAELWDLYGFEVGDTKIVKLSNANGISGDFGAYIVDFNHNYKIEGKGVTFSLGINSNGFNCVIGKTDLITESSPWEMSNTRNTICKQNVYDKLPSDLKAVIKTVKKYSQKSKSKVVVTQDKIFIPSVHEIMSGNDYGDIAGKYQTLYKYYLSGNSLKKSTYDAVNMKYSTGWVLRSFVNASDGLYITPEAELDQWHSTTFGLVPMFVI